MVNERRDLPVVGGIGGTNRINPRAAQDLSGAAQSTPPPGASLRDPAYHDICEFFASYPDGQAWQPARGDWVYLRATREVALVVDAEGGTADGPAQVTIAGSAGGMRTLGQEECVWLPTLDQLRTLIHDVYGSAGFFSSVFSGRTYWYRGELSGMQVEEMTPLSEGRSPEEAAVKALLMRFQR